MNPHLTVAPRASGLLERRFGWMFVVFSGLTILCGAIAMMATGIGLGLWLRNPAMWLLGCLICLWLVRLPMPPSWTGAILFIALSLTLAGPNLEGVRRWVALGPVQLNVAALVTPFALVLAARTVRQTAQLRHGLPILAMVFILAWQPDISQLSALLVALLAWSAIERDARALRWIIPAALVTLSVCLLRADPLKPVSYVEGILYLAADVTPILAVCCGGCLVLTSLSPLILAADVDKRPAAVSLAAYFVASSVAWLYGAYPVPLAGYGISFILGWLLGAAALLMR